VSQSEDSGLGDTLDVITENLTVTLGAPFTESVSSFASSTHIIISTDCHPIDAGVRVRALLSPVWGRVKLVLWLPRRSRRGRRMTSK